MMKTSAQRILIFITVLNALVCALLLTASGCKSSGAVKPSLSRTDRLVEAYPELSGGRFLVIADFEDPKHMELFQLLGNSDQAKRTLDTRLGLKTTGTACLSFTSGSANDAIVISNASASQWYLKQDWRAYDLLMMAIHVPQSDLSLQMTISGGPARDTRVAEITLPLIRGWNMTRFDLAQIAQHIPLDDVRQIRLSLSGHSKPIDLKIDDIILTGHRKDLLGDSTNRNLGLYVQQIGRRWRVGAQSPTADFEITFANGQIIEWYNMAADPYRMYNLLSGTALGPTPVVLKNNQVVADGFAPLGKTVLTRSNILEMSPVRVRILSEWHYVDSADDRNLKADPHSYHRWVYTIYPTGQIYLSVETTARTASWSAENLGLLISMATGEDQKNEVLIRHVSGSSKNASPNAPPYAVFRNRHDEAALLVVPDSSEQLATLRMAPPGPQDGSATSVTSVIVTGGYQENNIHRWNCHLFVTDNQYLTDEQAHARALNYTQPTPPHLEVGSFRMVNPSQDDRFGFDPATGSHLLTPDRGRLRLIWDDALPPSFNPILQIDNPTHREVWVYLDHRIFDKIDHTQSGDLILQLPPFPRKNTLLEVLFRTPTTP